jgi:hypothetical protein
MKNARVAQGLVIGPKAHTRRMPIGLLLHALSLVHSERVLDRRGARRDDHGTYEPGRHRYSTCPHPCGSGRNGIAGLPRYCGAGGR